MVSILKAANIFFEEITSLEFDRNRFAWRLFGNDHEAGNLSRKVASALPLFKFDSYFEKQDNYNAAIAARSKLLDCSIDNNTEGRLEALDVIHEHGFVHDTGHKDIELIMTHAIRRNDVDFVQEFLGGNGGLKFLSCAYYSDRGPTYTNYPASGEKGILSSSFGEAVIKEALLRGTGEMLSALSEFVKEPFLGRKSVGLTPVSDDISLALKNPNPGFAQEVIDFSLGLRDEHGGNLRTMVGNAMKNSINCNNTTTTRFLRENFMPGGTRAAAFTIDQKFADEILSYHANSKRGDIEGTLQLGCSEKAITQALQVSLYDSVNDWPSSHTPPSADNIKALIKAGADLNEGVKSLRTCLSLNGSLLNLPAGDRQRENLLEITRQFGFRDEDVIEGYAPKTAAERIKGHRDTQVQEEGHVR